MSGKIIERVRAREKTAEKNRIEMFKSRWATYEAEMNRKILQAEIEQSRRWAEAMKRPDDIAKPLWRRVFGL